jgi:hypothetical protein
MSIPPFAELIPVLQIAIGPVILISGVGLLLMSMTNRFGRVTDRSRALIRDLRAGNGTPQGLVRAQLRILLTRAEILRRAITLASVSILLAAMMIITLFFAALLRLDAGWLILILFTGCLGALIWSLLAFINDLNRSLEALNLELGDEITSQES